MNELLDRVRTEREVRGLSIRQAANGTSVSNTTWNRWERGGGPPPASIRKAVAEAFGWPLDWPENPPPLPVRPTENQTVLEQLEDMRRKLDAVLDALVSTGALAQAVREAAALADVNRSALDDVRKVGAAVLTELRELRVEVQAKPRRSTRNAH
jgi:transcriptional regulator with XRE-family HTH domain